MSKFECLSHDQCIVFSIVPLPNGVRCNTTINVQMSSTYFAIQVSLHLAAERKVINSMNPDKLTQSWTTLLVQHQPRDSTNQDCRLRKQVLVRQRKQSDCTKWRWRNLTKVVQPHPLKEVHGCSGQPEPEERDTHTRRIKGRSPFWLRHETKLLTQEPSCVILKCLW